MNPDRGIGASTLFMVVALCGCAAGAWAQSDARAAAASAGQRQVMSASRARMGGSTQIQRPMNRPVQGSMGGSLGGSAPRSSPGGVRSITVGEPHPSHPGHHPSHPTHPSGPEIPYTKPQPRWINEPGKPWVYTTVPQPLGTVPVSVVRGPVVDSPLMPGERPALWGNYDGFERPIRRGGSFGGVPARFPNVLSPARSSVPETYGPVVVRNNHNHYNAHCPTAPWACPVDRGSRWVGSGHTKSMIGPSGALLFADGGSSGSSVAFSSGSGFSANIDTGNVQIHIGASPPLWNNSWCGTGSGGWNNWCGEQPIVCGSVCNPYISPVWDYGWWTWYDSTSYIGPVYGTGWYQYDPALFYPASATQSASDPQPADPAADSQANPNEQLVGAATILMTEAQYTDAARLLREYTRREPADAGAWRWLGVALLADRQSKDAVYAFAQAYRANEGLADLALEYEAMGLDRSDLRDLCTPLLTYARVTKSADAYMMAAVIMDARGLKDQARRLLGEAKAAGLDVMLAQRIAAGFAK
ncbi:MAG: hypothetical protein IT435_03550 [Phycisphaerales bacterium]|nr:hypothetical protein [Phycisphaerales bacterium]